MTDANAEALQSANQWPPKHSLFGLHVSCVEYDEAVASILAAAQEGRPAVVSCHAVHAVTTISEDKELRAAANRFAMIAPDGQPVRWALNLLYKTRLRERVYGPELMRRLVAAAAQRNLPIYLYGGTPESLIQLQQNLSEEYPELVVAGSQSPPFRELSELELTAVAEDINRSRAKLVFIGLGCPKQDRFAAMQAERIHAVQICVGAAFDFHAHIKPMAPRWMQARGLEWLYRLGCEPRRLWKRYLISNSKFCLRLAIAFCSSRQNPNADSL